MWIASKALYTSPFDEKITALTEPQVTWILANYYKDQDLEFDKFKLMCRFLNPKAAHEIFDKEDEMIVTEVGDEAFLNEIKEHATGEISLDTLNTVSDVIDVTNNDDLDIIEPIEG